MLISNTYKSLNTEDFHLKRSADILANHQQSCVYFAIHYILILFIVCDSE
jgi:hypothetical protein